jgi:hypothetical protein
MGELRIAELAALRQGSYALMDAQYFVIGTDGRHHGPLTQDDVRTWLADGRASRYSRARRDSEDQWSALRDMPEFEADTRPPYVGGGTPATASDIEAPAEEAGLPPSTLHLDPVSCFKRAWWLVARDFGVLAGWTLLVAMAIIATGLIPRVGWLVGLLVNNLLMAGVYLLFLSRMRGLRPSLADIVSAVRASAVTIIVAGFAQLAMTAVGLLLLILPGIYLAVGYAFVLPLIIDRRLPVWEAMELSRTTVHRQWFQTFGLLLAAGMLLFLSAAAFGVALVLTLPLCTAALMFAYEDMFGV